MGLALLLAPGAGPRGAGAGVVRALAAGGLIAVPGPAESGDLVLAQLASGSPWPEAVTWAAVPSGVVVRVSAGATGGLDPGFARALSAELGGLVLAMDADRTRERYLLGSFLAGRTIELTTCDGGMVTGPGGRGVCDEDEVVARFTRWSGGADLLRIGHDGASGLLATGKAEWPSDQMESPLARVAVAGADIREVPGWRRREREPGVVVFERDGELDTALMRSLGRPAVGLHLPGRGRDTRWLTIDADGELRRGQAHGHEELVADVPEWALA